VRTTARSIRIISLQSERQRAQPAIISLQSERQCAQPAIISLQSERQRAQPAIISLQRGLRGFPLTEIIIFHTVIKI